MYLFMCIYVYLFERQKKMEGFRLISHLLVQSGFFFVPLNLWFNLQVEQNLVGQTEAKKLQFHLGLPGG